MSEMNSPEKAAIFLQVRADSGAQYSPGHCLGAQRDAYFGEGQHAFGGTAATAYAATKNRGAGPAPFGALVWWTGGSAAAGHVAFSLGDGTCLTTDFGPQYIGDGRIRQVTIAAISAHDPALIFKGWSYDLDGEQPPKEGQLILVKKTTVSTVYGYLGNCRLAPSEHQVQRLVSLGAAVHTLPDNDEIFGLPVLNPTAAAGSLPAHVHPIAPSQTGAAK